jgi:hypothetical protein
MVVKEPRRGKITEQNLLRVIAKDHRAEDRARGNDKNDKNIHAERPLVAQSTV